MDHLTTVLKNLEPKIRTYFQSRCAVPEDVEESIRQMRAAPPLREMPLIVISTGRSDLAALGSPWDKVEEAWTELHTELANLVPGGKLVIDEESGHRPHIDNPQLVVEAIREVVEATRA